MDKVSSVNFVKAPFSGGQPRPGAELGANCILGEELLINNLRQQGITFSSTGISNKTSSHIHHNHPASFVNGIRNFQLVSEFNKELHKEVSQAFDGSFVVTLGGDHSVAIGSISAVLKRYPELVVLWVDAHADINTLETTMSGNLHGTPVSFLMGLGSSEMDWLDADLDPSKIVYIGLRDVEPQEQEIIDRLGIRAYSMQDVASKGIEVVISEILEFIGEFPVHISLDVDGIDPDYTPATGTPVERGLSFKDCEKLFESVRQDKKIVSMDYVEVNPLLGNEGEVERTVYYGNRLLETVLGIRTNQSHSP